MSEPPRTIHLNGDLGPRVTNQGTPTIEDALDAVRMEDLAVIAAALWTEARSHGMEPTRGGCACECVAIEAVARLIHLGYRIEKVK